MKHTKQSLWYALTVSNRTWVLMMLPAFVGFVLFSYLPIFGVVAAFQDYNPVRGFWKSDWVGFEQFRMFFDDPYFFRIIRNTVLLSFYSLITGFLFPIGLALLLNEMTRPVLKRVIQSISYLPHFLSTVVVVGLIDTIFATDGPINKLMGWMGSGPIVFMSEPSWFRFLYVSSGVWQGVGWAAIIYLAAMTSVNPELYEAADMDGASRWNKMWHVTLPAIRSVMAILLIFQVAGLLDVGFEKVYLMYSPATYETADVIQTYIYRQGIQSGDYSYAAAIGLFNSVISVFLLLIANYTSKKLADTGIL